MENKNIVLGSETSEINLLSFARKVWEKKWYFIVFVPISMAIAYAYTKYTPPVYEVTTSLLIDVNASARTLGVDRNGQKVLSPIEAEKNLFNEMGIMQSFKLVKETVEQLGFHISYYTKSAIKTRESYGYFPFEAVFADSSSQIIDVPFEVEIISEDEFRLSISESEFSVTNPSNGTVRDVKQELDFTGTFVFGQTVLHDYFNFRLEKPTYKVNMSEFQDMKLLFKLHRIEDVANNYRDILLIEQGDVQASIINLTSRGEVPDKEIDFLEALTDNYIQTQLNKRRNIATDRIAGIRQNIANINDSLKTAERRLESFRSATGSVNLSKSAENSLDLLKTLEAQKSELELNNKYFSSVLTYLQDSAGINKIVMPSTQGISDPVLTENLIELRKKQAERNDKAIFSGEKSLDIEVLDNQIAELTRSVKENISNLVNTSSLTLNEKKRQISAETVQLSRLPNNERNLVRFERDAFRFENMYNYLNLELTKLMVSAEDDMSDTQVIDAPRIYGDGPVAPQKMLIYLLGLMIGLFIPFGIIAISNTVTEHITSIDQIERIAGIPVASSIGHFGMSKDGRIIEAHKWKLEESFRDLSASLQFLLPNSQNNIIGVTSTIPGEGKTFCATNLGMNFAEGGKKILLIDTDLRNPSLVEDIEKVKGKGLVNYLQGEIEFFNEIIYEHDEIDNLHYIPTFPIEGNPHKLLTSPRLRSLLNDLKDEYDYIIFDSPPVGLVSDYLLISKYFDIHLFVVRRKYSKLQYLRDVEKIQTRGNLQNMYIIFNDVKDDAFKYGYNTYEYRDSRKLKDIKKKIKK